MYFQLVENQVLSTQGQPDVNLHRLTVVGHQSELYNILKEETVQGESNKEARDYAMATNGGLTVGMCNRLL